MSKVRLHIVLDNIRSAFNVGSIFRSADGAGDCMIHLCGITTTPDNPKIGKTALGSTGSVPFKYYHDTLEAVRQLKKEGIPIYGVEITEKSEHFQKIEYPDPVALVFGHELTGVNQPVLDMCDKLIYIPMKGIKESLNVAVSASIIIFEAMRE